MKKTTIRAASILLVLTVLIQLFVPALPSHAAAQYGTVIAEDVNFRAEPDTDSRVLLKLPLQAQLEIISYESNWYQAIYDDVVGYIRQDMIYVGSDTPRMAYVKSDAVTLYGGADFNSYTAGELSAGEAVKIRGLVGEWYYVVTGYESGYVHCDYITMSTPGSTALGRMLSVGMEGQEVVKLQSELYERGFLSIVDLTGHYGSKTRQAVRGFQQACGLQADGIAGDATLALIYDENNTVTSDTAMFNQVNGTVELLAWDEGGSSWLGRGSYFIVTDVRTGMSFNARRFGGWLHADSEPVTADDTAIMKAISGGEWSWNRRPIWITYNGRTVAASMHTMPHMANPTVSNNFDGHFCIHLFHSKVHATERECPRHQACVMEAYNAGKGD